MKRMMMLQRMRFNKLGLVSRMTMKPRRRVMILRVGGKRGHLGRAFLLEEEEIQRELLKMIQSLHPFQFYNKRQRKTWVEANRDLENQAVHHRERREPALSFFLLPFHLPTFLSQPLPPPQRQKHLQNQKLRKLLNRYPHLQQPWQQQQKRRRPQLPNPPKPKPLSQTSLRSSLQHHQPPPLSRSYQFRKPKPRLVRRGKLKCKRRRNARPLYLPPISLANPSSHPPISPPHLVPLPTLPQSPKRSTASAVSPTLENG